MATGLVAKAQGRAEDVPVAIERLLTSWKAREALNKAIGAFQGEASKLRGWRPADAALIDAESAGSLAATAASLRLRSPRRPDGCRGMPAPEHLIAVFRAAYAPDLTQICEHIATRTGVDSRSVAAVLRAYQEM